MTDDPQMWLRDLLPGEDVPDEVGDPLGYLSGRYGEPERSREGDVERLSFDLPDRRLEILLSTATAQILGGLVFQQGPPPPPCPSGATFTPIATGTAFYILNPGGAFQRALARALANGIANYRALRGLVCPALCPPPCSCNTPLAGAPGITQTNAVRRVWGIPVGFDLTVSINATFNVVCV